MIYEIRNILAPINFKVNSMNALEFAVKMAVSHKANLILANIVPVNLNASKFEGSIVDSVVLNELKQEAVIKTNQVAEKIRKEYKINVQIRCEIGEIDRSIGTIIKLEKIDLVVLGAKATKGRTDLYLKSPIKGILNLSDCPVMIVPAEYKFRNFQEIIYPVRHVDGVSQKFDYVKPLVEFNNSQIHLLGIANKRNSSKMQSEFLRTGEKIGRYTSNITYQTIVSDHVTEKILELAIEKRADLLVINATSELEEGNYYPENYTFKIIFSAQMPVLCVKPDLTSSEIGEENYYLMAESVFPYQKSKS